MLVAGLAGQVLATEGGGGAYPNGAEGFMTGAVPPPGNYIIDYNLWYTADKFANANGDDFVFVGPNGPTESQDFDLTVGGTVVRLIHVTKQHVFGGLWAQQIFVPLLYVDVDHPVLGKEDKFGLGDLIVDPVVVSWHKGKIHCAAGVDTYVPVGAYDKDDVANIGRNYWTIEPVVACSYLDRGWDVSAKAMYDFNMKNDDTDVQSGDEFHVDYAVGKVVKNWKLGAGGYYYKQVSDDDYPAGYPPPAQLGKGQAMAAGPQVAYAIGKLTFVAAYQEEFEVENKPEGQRMWLKIIAPL